MVREEIETFWPIGSSLDIGLIISVRVIDFMECFEVGGKGGGSLVLQVP